MSCTGSEVVQDNPGNSRDRINSLKPTLHNLIHQPQPPLAMWLMLQLERPEDFVIATGETHSVREFVETAFSFVGCKIVWQGSGLEEVGKDADTGIIRVRINPKYFRPTEVDMLLGDSTKARKTFGWAPKVTFKELVQDMVLADLELMKKNPMA